MASRIKDFLQFEDRKKQDVSDILEFNGVQVALYRRASSSGDGFEQEVGDESFIVRFTAEINEYDGTSERSEGQAITKPQFIMVCNYRDLRPDDICLINGDRYIVVSIDKSPTGHTNTIIERLI